MFILFRSSLGGWSVGSQEAALQDVDYISFLFSTLTGFTSDKLASLQVAGHESALPCSPLSPLSLYPTQLEQFTHHWDIVEVRSLHICTVFIPVSLKPHIHSSHYVPFRNTQKNTFKRDGELEVKAEEEKHCFENCWYSGHSCGLSVPPVSDCLSHRAQRVEALSWHSSWEGKLYRVAQVGDVWLSGIAHMHKC